MQLNSNHIFRIKFLTGMLGFHAKHSLTANLIKKKSYLLCKNLQKIKITLVIILYNLCSIEAGFPQKLPESIYKVTHASGLH